MPASKNNATTTNKNNNIQSRTIVLKLSSTLLSRFPSDSPAVDDKDVKVKDASSPPSSTSGETGVQASSFDNASDAASTPAAAAEGSGKGKKTGGAAAAATSRGTKRALNQNGESKPPRSRPSVKKRLKMYLFLPILLTPTTNLGAN